MTNLSFDLNSYIEYADGIHKSPPIIIIKTVSNYHTGNFLKTKPTHIFVNIFPLYANLFSYATVTAPLPHTKRRFKK